MNAGTTQTFTRIALPVGATAVGGIFGAGLAGKVEPGMTPTDTVMMAGAAVMAGGTIAGMAFTDEFEAFRPNKGNLIAGALAGVGLITAGTLAAKLLPGEPS